MGIRQNNLIYFLIIMIFHCPIGFRPRKISGGILITMEVIAKYPRSIFIQPGFPDANAFPYIAWTIPVLNLPSPARTARPMLPLLYQERLTRLLSRPGEQPHFNLNPIHFMMLARTGPA